MRCQRAQQQLMAYHDEELSKGAGKRLEKHLKACTECSQLLENLRLADHHASSFEGVNQMVGVPDMPPPEDGYWKNFTARVMDRVEEDAATRAPYRTSRQRKWNLNIPRMAPAFSIALVIVVAVGVLYRAGDLVPVPKTVDPVKQTTRDIESIDVPPDISIDNRQPDQKEFFNKARDEGDRGDGAPKVSSEDDLHKPASSAPVAVVDAATPAKLPAAADRERARADEEAVRTRKSIPEAAPVPEPKAIKEPEPDLAVKMREEREGSVANKKSQAAASTAVEVATDTDVPDTAKAQAVKDTSEPSLEPVLSMEAAMEPAELAQEEAGRISAEPVEEASSVISKAQGNVQGFSEKEDDSILAEVADKPEPAAPEEAHQETGEEKNEVARTLPDEEPEESISAVSRIQTPDSALSSRVTMPRSGSESPYRGPEEQLVHARSLADVRKFWESEQVLKDLLSQQPPAPIQEEASILLVKVLSSQNRIGEAQQALDDAKGKFPANDMIQTYELKPIEGKPVQ